MSQVFPGQDGPSGMQPFASAVLHGLYGWVARCIHLLIGAGVPDALGDEPQAAVDLAKATGCHPDALERMLRLVSSVGIFERRPDGRYAHTDVSRCYRRSSPLNARSTVMMAGTPLTLGVQQHLDHSLKSGKSALSVFAPEGQWVYYQSHPEEARVFSAAMSEQSRMSGAAVIAAYDFSAFDEVADLGGGQGAFIKSILDACPRVRGLLLELPEVIANVDGSDRLRLVPGSFFADVPPGCDAYILKNVLHDWNDEKALEILANVRHAARPGARLLVVESVRHDGPGFHMSLMLDVMMLAIHGGRERSRDEFEALFARTGFRLERVVPTAMDLAKIVEAVAV